MGLFAGALLWWAVSRTYVRARAGGGIVIGIGIGASRGTRERERQADWAGRGGGRPRMLLDKNLPERRGTVVGYVWLQSYYAPG